MRDLKGKTAEELGALIQEYDEKISALGFKDVDALIADRSAIADEKEKLEGRVNNAEELINRQGNELGELRKKAGVKEPVASKKDGGEGKDKTGDRHEETLEEVESSLSDGQWEAADVVFNSLHETEPNEAGLSKEIIASDPGARKKFLQIARGTVTQIPKSLKELRGRKVDSKTNEEDRIKALFEKAKQKQRFVPGGGCGGNALGGDELAQRRPALARSRGVLAAAKAITQE